MNPCDNLIARKRISPELNLSERWIGLIACGIFAKFGPDVSLNRQRPILGVAGWRR